MLAQCATAAFLFGAGDVLAQQAIEKAGSKHDVSWICIPLFLVPWKQSWKQVQGRWNFSRTVVLITRYFLGSLELCG